MRTSRCFLLLGLGLLPLLLLGTPTQTQAMCCPIPCIDCDLESQGQLNLVIMDRGLGKIRLIPNIRITGVAEDFALIVPTPSLPSFRPVSREIWAEAIALTAPLPPRRSGGNGLGCGTSSDSFSPIVLESGDDRGVSVVSQETVGGFIATVIQSDDPDALIDWLNQNDFSLDPADVEKFAPYVEAGWVFTTMKLDPTVDPPPFWDINVDPVEISYDATELEIPLPILSINRAANFPMVFFVVDEHRTHLPEFDTTYGNQISPRETKTISAAYPSLGSYLNPGDFLTRLDGRFAASEPMDKSIMLEQADTDGEFRRAWGAAQEGSLGGSLLGALAVLMGVLLLARVVLRRRYAAF